MEGTRLKLGELLVAQELITREQLDAALAEQAVDGGRLGEVLVRQLVLTESEIAQALAQREGLRYVDMTRVEIDREAVVAIPAKMAQRRQMMPVGFDGARLVVAMADPLDVQAIDEARLWSRREIEPVVAPASQVRYAIDKFVVEGGALEALESLREETMPEPEVPTDLVGEVPVVRVLNQLLREAVLDRASDMHFEPEEGGVRVRSRIDGVLVDVVNLPKSSQASLISRLKVMADMDITERRLPQDGRIVLRVGDRSVDMRVATLPTPLGESIVVRVLDSSGQARELSEVGLGAENRATLERMLARSYGAILVTGPTGSGKTTTLYAAITTLNKPSRKIITVEDPIEYRMRGLTQIAVNSRIGLTFASGLRQILRADPDVVMVGEVRDAETAGIAVRAALTGHLVLTSIHTNDAPSAFTRLAEMGIETYISSSALVGAIAQRLVRVLCPSCKAEVHIAPEKLLAAGFAPEELPGLKLRGPVGCSACRGTGYRGRIGVFEIMEMNDELERLVLANATAQQLRESAMRNGMRSLRRDALDKVATGVTSLEEVIRVLT